MSFVPWQQFLSNRVREWRSRGARRKRPWLPVPLRTEVELTPLKSKIFFIGEAYEDCSCFG